MRRENGYRDYPPATVGLFTFVDRGQALGFTLTELSAALASSPNDIPAGVELLGALRAKRVELNRLIRSASARRRQIDRLVAELESCELAAEASD